MFSDLTGLVRRVGLRDASVEVIRRAVNRVSFGACSFTKYYIFVQPLEGFPEIPARRGASFLVRPVLSGDPVLDGFPRPGAEILERYAAGAECMLVEHRGELAGFMWWRQGGFREPRAAVEIRPSPAAQTVWDFDVYIAPRFRAGLAFYRLWSGAAAYLRARGVRYSLSFVYSHNEMSISSHLKLGAYPIASGYQFKAGDCSLTLGDRSPRLSLVKAGSRAPVIELDARASACKPSGRFRSHKPQAGKSISSESTEAVGG